MMSSTIMQQNLEVAKRKYLKAKKAYYNSDPIMTDAEFDKLEDAIRKLDPKWKFLKKTGVKVSDKKTEIEHERFMPSLNKKYPEDMPKWLTKPLVRDVESWTLMDKLDGTSLQLIYDKGRPVKLVTRGDGALGGDISFFLPWLVKNKQIPAMIAEKKRTVLRCEALMPRAVFESKWSREAKGDKGFDNGRNLVNGLFNRKDEHQALKDVHVVVLGIYDKTMLRGLKQAEIWKFKVVPWVFADDPDDLEPEGLAKYLSVRREDSIYEMDGLVLVPADWMYVYEENEKPKVMPMAFKVNDISGAPLVVLKKLIWQKTRTSRWQPVFEIPPTLMDGAEVTRCTGNNPQWMLEKGVGVGATVRILRSGGVIPKIVEVVKKAKLTPPPGPYTVKGAYWMIASGASDPAVRAQANLFFLQTMGVENIALKTLIRIMDSGLAKTQRDFALWAKPGLNQHQRRSRLVSKAGFGPKQAQIIDGELTRAFSGKVIPMRQLMVASGFFPGIGDRKLKSIEDQGISMDKLLTLKDVKFLTAIEALKGFSHKSAVALHEGVTEFNAWIEGDLSVSLDLDGSLPKKKKAVAGDLSGQKFSWTGYRSIEEENAVTSRGGEVIKYGAKTDVLFYNPTGKFMDKVEKAKCKTAVYKEWAK